MPGFVPNWSANLSGKNVKDFGAVGNGVVDDTAAIQAAVDWTAGASRGVIFFPEGTYKVTSPITFDYDGELSIIFRGCGRLSKITGSVNGAIIDRSYTNPTSGIRCVEYLAIENSHASGIGVRMLGTVGGIIQNCHISAHTGIVADTGNTWSILNCNLVGDGSSGSIGIMASNAVGIYACDITGWEEGIRHYSVGLVVSACRLEVNTTGILLGKQFDGDTEQSNGFVLEGLSMEANQTAIDCYAAVQGAINGVSIGGGVSMVRGIYLHGAADTVLSGVTVSGSYTTAAIDGNNNGGVAFIGVGSTSSGAGPAWLIDDDHKYTAAFIQSNNPTMAFPFSKLPTPVEGMEYDLTDSNTAVWGATAAGGGANRVKVRYNGSNWTVVGK